MEFSFLGTFCQIKLREYYLNSLIEMQAPLKLHKKLFISRAFAQKRGELLGNLLKCPMTFKCNYHE